MNLRKIALLLCIVITAGFVFGACGLFGGKEETVTKDGLPELSKRVYWSPGGEFVTNVKDNNKKLSRTVVSLLFTKDMSTDLELNVAPIRNVILQILMEKTEADLTADDVLTVLENEMTEKLSAFLGMNEFLRVYISDFVMQ